MKIQPIWMPIVDVLKVILLPLIISYVIAYILHPIVEKLHKKGISKGLAILLIYLVVFSGVGFGIYKVYPIVIEQMQEIGEQAPEFVYMYENMNEKIEERTDHMPRFIHNEIDDTIGEVERKVQGLTDVAIETTKGLANHAVTIALVPFIVFYLLKDYGSFQQYFWQFIPPKWHDEMKNILGEINRSLGWYIRGQLVVCLFLMIMGTIAFWVIHLRYPLLLGIIIGITDIIPYFGPIIGAIPALIFASTMSTSKILMVIAIVIVLQFIESNILSPYIVGKSIHIHPIFIIFALLAGGTIGGLVGIFLSIPALVIAKIFITQFRRALIRRKIQKGV